MKKVFVGTSGYTYNHWKKIFYPEDLSQREWLKYYCQYFNAVEINTSFYHSLKKEIYKRWRIETPKDFKFFIKGHRFITVAKRLKDIDDSVRFFFAPVFALKEKLAGVLWQFPPNFKFTEEIFRRLKHFLSILPKKIIHAFEFRNESWFNPEVYGILKFYNAAFVFVSLAVEEVTADFVYIRFHGPGAIYTSLYSEAEMKEWVAKIKVWKKKYDIYVYFNNDANANAVKNAKQLIKLLA